MCGNRKMPGSARDVFDAGGTTEPAPAVEMNVSFNYQG
ncbi:hypothetical protein CFter6_3414 [Collimonas fungivorans]|uniref:Uncharacterized protein n=1 Tax=Collimonas fungivorans TaxID=158899 RepID=A0A127PE62_9BURK|nr:hypothetical protein CFter6_3414 [Collimonas fungivorans]